LAPSEEGSNPAPEKEKYKGSLEKGRKSKKKKNYFEENKIDFEMLMEQNLF
jgi:hypothetical protein